MSTNIIYFTTRGRCEKAEFSTNDSCQEVTDLFRAAADAHPHDIVKLYKQDGCLINVSPHLEPNTPSNPYTLVIVSTSVESLVEEVGGDFRSIEDRLQALEMALRVEKGGMPSDSIQQVRNQVDVLRSKLENIEHLSWIGLNKDMNGVSRHNGSLRSAALSNGTSTSSSENARVPSPNFKQWKKQESAHHRHGEECEKVFSHFHHLSHMELKPEVKKRLESVDFNNWQWKEWEMLSLIRHMYIDLDFLNTFNIPNNLFHRWLCEIYSNYNRVPFHNFKHCFMVTQMMYGLIKQLKLQEVFSQTELFALLTSAICHDLDHPGYNNTYQINAQTELAVRYNDVSPLENHHCCVAFRIFAKDECNILKHVPEKTFRQIRQSMIRCILATDMARHNDILADFQQTVPKFDFKSDDHRNQLMMILIKCADISNECRPMEVAEPWIDCLLQEFFHQSDVEKQEGLPVSPFMDRDKVNKNSSQVNFIKFVLLPLFHSLADLYPSIQEPILLPLESALEYYDKLAKCQNNLPLHKLNNGTSL